MSTKIFENYQEFLLREDKSENGVSVKFSTENPNWESENEKNEMCWNCIDCSDCMGCIGCIGCIDATDCIDCIDCSDCMGCIGCIGCIDATDCIDCSDCSDCFGCRDCRDCNDCSDCSDLKNNTESFYIPKIENIHQKLLEKVESKSDSLNMSTWHTCDTTHCRAGWIVNLAGEEGYKLESETSTCFAAMMIYKSSSKIRVFPPRFFETNEIAMKDIVRCAELEKK